MITVLDLEYNKYENYKKNLSLIICYTEDYFIFLLYVKVIK